MDLMHNTLAYGRRILSFSLVNVYSRECVALVASTQFRGTDVLKLLQEAGARTRKLPAINQCDHGTEFTSDAFDHWA